MKLNTIDYALENLVKEVELYGRSGGDSIFLTNVTLTVKDEDFEVPFTADLDGAYVDFDWFLRCAKARREEPHPSPDKSFWLRTFGEKAVPYGACWNLSALKDNLSKPERWRKCLLFNSRSSEDPSCVTSYQFLQHEHHILDVIVTMRSSDVYGVLPQDLLMTWFLLKHVCEENGLRRGSITLNLANAHVFYENCMWQEEFTIDGLD